MRRLFPRPVVPYSLSLPEKEREYLREIKCNFVPDEEEESELEREGEESGGAGLSPHRRELL